MKKATKKLKGLEILFPNVRAQLLGLLFTAPFREQYVRELARTADLALATVQQELSRLTSAGLVTSQSDGFHRFYRANRKHPLFHSVQRLVVTAGRRPITERRKTPRQSWRQSPKQARPNLNPKRRRLDQRLFF